MSADWDPQRYLTYADERGRPFVDLIARIDADPAEGVASVVDLGCGPGNLTALLARRWPRAGVTGVDSSPEMIARARSEVPGLDFRVADLRDWIADPGRGPVDVLVSNATLQWVPGHLDLLPALVAAVRPGGWLALQVPGNFEQPSHTLLEEVADLPAHREHTRGAARPAAHDAATYLDALAALGCAVDAWETTYLHVLRGEDPVFTWVSGTAARPVLQALPDELRPGFVEAYKARLRASYPMVRVGDEPGVVLPFRRVFAVARVPDHEEEA
ncbi:methyltransferase domain-containing protein [Nocardioides sambongensis]|uniref:methyltransferase domain-containing protein n=1 Tax=Nocardioides sambongensis TaxID=2589074 RepID=UPI001126DE0D|nr:methyltransferase domain-containing protein [Nocardioides sambongensis]